MTSPTPPPDLDPAALEVARVASKEWHEPHGPNATLEEYIITKLHNAGLLTATRARGEGSANSLRSANAERQREWDKDSKISLTYRGNELAGETGEACNVIKKLERERLGIRGSRATKQELSDELADVVICADLIAMYEDIDLLGTAVPQKFNATSEKYGLKTKLTALPHPQASSADMRAFGASEAACILWPDDSEAHGDLRRAYIRGAADCGDRPQASWDGWMREAAREILDRAQDLLESKFYNGLESPLNEIATIISRHAAKAQVPDGWKLVEISALKIILKGVSGPYTPRNEIAKLVAAMLAASPSPDRKGE